MVFSEQTDEGQAKVVRCRRDVLTQPIWMSKPSGNIEPDRNGRRAAMQGCAAGVFTSRVRHPACAILGLEWNLRADHGGG
jgi:hypothetical protein